MSDELVCKVCKKTIPVSGFYYVAAKKESTCKECTKAAVKENRLRNIEKYKEYDRERNKSKERIEMRARYAKTEAGKEAGKRAKKKWTENNAVKRAAHVILGNAIRDKKLFKPEACEGCGEIKRLHAHHDDYAKPLEVKWLCSKCHRKHHETELSNDNN